MIFNGIKEMTLHESNEVYRVLSIIQNKEKPVKTKNEKDTSPQKRKIDYNWAVDEILAKAPSYEKSKNK